jgi:hypothetical protein
MKLCAKCNESPRWQDFKYCRVCRDIVLNEMNKAGYLTPVNVRTARQGDEQRGRRQLAPDRQMEDGDG